MYFEALGEPVCNSGHNGKVNIRGGVQQQCMIRQLLVRPCNRRGHGVLMSERDDAACRGDVPTCVIYAGLILIVLPRDAEQKWLGRMNE